MHSSPQKECILPLNGNCQTLIRQYPIHKRMHSSPQKECILPLNGNCQTLIRQYPIHKRMHSSPQKECILPFKGFTQFSSHLIFMNPHFYESLVKGTKGSFLATTVSPILWDSTCLQSFQTFLRLHKIESKRIH